MSQSFYSFNYSKNSSEKEPHVCCGTHCKRRSSSTSLFNFSMVFVTRLYAKKITPHFEQFNENFHLPTGSEKRTLLRVYVTFDVRVFNFFKLFFYFERWLLFLSHFAQGLFFLCSRVGEEFVIN